MKETLASATSACTGTPTADWLKCNSCECYKKSTDAKLAKI